MLGYPANLAASALLGVLSGLVYHHLNDKVVGPFVILVPSQELTSIERDTPKQKPGGKCKGTFWKEPSSRVHCPQKVAGGLHRTPFLQLTAFAENRI